MFQLNENCEIGQRLLKCEYLRFSPAETSTTKTPNSKIDIKKPRKDSVIPLLNRYLESLKLSKTLIIPEMVMVMV